MGDRIELRADPEPEAVERVASVLRAGGVALLPAEGVYGYHALARSDAGVVRLQALKGGPERAGFLSLVACPEDAERWAELLPAARDLIRAHWPGPLTLVLPARPAAPPSARATDGTVALRCPGSAFLRAVAAAAEDLVLSTSANRPGHPPAIRADDAPGEGVDLIVDGGTLSGVSSTLARVDRDGVRVLRAGAVPLGDAALDGPREGP